MNNFKKITLVLLFVLPLIGFSSCSNETKQESIVDKIKRSGTITLATSADYPPFETHEMVNGKDEIVGLDIKLANKIASKLGVELKIQDVSFDAVLTSLSSGQADIAIAGIGSNPLRDKTFDHTNTYYVQKPVIVVKKEDVDKYTSIESLTGKRLGTQAGSSKEDLAKEHLTNANFVSQKNANNLLAGLKGNSIDAVILDSPVANEWILNNKDIALSSIPLDFEDSIESLTIFLQKGHEDLKAILNEVIDKEAKDIYPKI